MVSCNGGDDGALCFSVLGGCAPYSVIVNGVSQTSVTGDNICFDELPAGDYNIIIQDSGTPQMNLLFPFEITEPDPIIIGSLVNMKCTTICARPSWHIIPELRKFDISQPPCNCANFRMRETLLNSQ